MIEDDFHPGRELRLANPVAAIRAVSRDTTLRTKMDLAAGGALTALEMQWECTTSPASTPRSGAWRPSGASRSPVACSTAGKASSSAWRPIRSPWPASSTGSPSSGSWRPTRSATDSTGTTRSWPASTCSTTTCGLPSPCSPRLAMETLTDDEQVAAATTAPPSTTRAYFRGRCLEALLLCDRRRQLGLGRVRHRRGPAAARADDGAVEGDSAPCRYAFRRMRDSGRAT